MEKWTRGLSKTTAMMIGCGTVAAMLAFYIIFGSFFSGFIPIIILCALLVGGGFASPMFYKGITGYTPQERK